MNTEAIEALQKSIAHWERMLDSTPSIDAKDKVGARHCALCQIYMRLGACPGCPVSEHTGFMRCRHTPYGEASYQWSRIAYLGHAEAINDWKIAAKAEIDFLKSLLPGPSASNRTHLTNVDGYRES